MYSKLRIFVFLWVFILLFGCSSQSGIKATGSIKDYWVGKWEDGTGYWLDISVDGDVLALERSGGGTLKVLQLSPDNKTLIYHEDTGIGGIEYEHTMVLKDENLVEDTWFDVKSNRVWDVMELKR